MFNRELESSKKTAKIYNTWNILAVSNFCCQEGFVWHITPILELQATQKKLVGKGPIHDYFQLLNQYY